MSGLSPLRTGPGSPLETGEFAAAPMTLLEVVPDTEDVGTGMVSLCRSLDQALTVYW